MRVLVWQWGRRGAGPLVAVAMARELAGLPGVETRLSLAKTAELLQLADGPTNDVPMRTYRDRLGFVGRMLASPLLVPAVARAVAELRVDVALCAMPAPLDFVMAAALRRVGVPYAVVVHDAQLHPGDAFPMQIALQRSLLRGAGMLFTLSGHVGEQLRMQGLRPGQRVMQASLPPFVFGPPAPPVGRHGGRLRLLSFGRLLPYKGLDLLADAMAGLPVDRAVELRVVGLGPESAALDRLRAMPGVAVENRWVPEAELGELLGWADALVLTHLEASQSGVAAAAISARRWVVATRVGGLAEQLSRQEMAVMCAPEAGSVAAGIESLLGREAPALDVAENWRDSADVVATGLRQMLPEVTAAPEVAQRVA